MQAFFSSSSAGALASSSSYLLSATFRSFTFHHLHLLPSQAMAPMRTTLLLMLLFVAFATAHAVSVSTENKTPSSITLNGVSIGAGAKEDIEVNGVVALEVVDVAGEKHYGTYAVPADVTALGLVYEDGFVKLKVADTDPNIDLGGLLKTLIDLLLGLLEVLLGGGGDGGGGGGGGGGGRGGGGHGH